MTVFKPAPARKTTGRGALNQLDDELSASSSACDPLNSLSSQFKSSGRGALNDLRNTFPQQVSNSAATQRSPVSGLNPMASSFVPRLQDVPPDEELEEEEHEEVPLFKTPVDKLFEIEVTDDDGWW